MRTGGEEWNHGENHLDVGGGVLPVHPLSLHRLGRRCRGHERPHPDHIRPLGRPHHNPRARNKTPPKHHSGSSNERGLAKAIVGRGGRYLDPKRNRGEVAAGQGERTGSMTEGAAAVERRRRRRTRRWGGGGGGRKRSAMRDGEPRGLLVRMALPCRCTCGGGGRRNLGSRGWGLARPGVVWMRRSEGGEAQAEGLAAGRKPRRALPSKTEELGHLAFGLPSKIRKADWIDLGRYFWTVIALGPLDFGFFLQNNLFKLKFGKNSTAIAFKFVWVVGRSSHTLHGTMKNVH
jgi:hypothetical protein